MATSCEDVQVSGQIDFNSSGLLLREDSGKLWTLMLTENLLIGEEVTLLGSRLGKSGLLVKEVVQRS